MSTTVPEPAGLLRNRNFVLVWCAYAVSAFGDHLSELAILKTFNALDASVDITPLTARMTFVFFAPFFALSLVTGVLADRLPRRGLMVVADVARCVVMLFMANLIARMQPWGSWGAFLPLLFVGAFAAVFSPARSALLPTIIRPEQLVRANGMISGLGIIATMGAAVAGGYLANHYPPRLAFQLDAATFAISAGFLLFVRPPATPQGEDGGPSPMSAFRDIRDGIGYARGHRRVLELLAVAALVWFCGPLVSSVTPAIVRDVYGGDYQSISSFRAFLGLGFVAGAILISVLGDALRSEIAMTWGLFGISAGIGVVTTSVFLPCGPATLYWIGAVGTVLAGIFAIGVMASFNSLLQRTTANRFRGRVFGLNDLCTITSLLLATGLLGVPSWERVDRWVGYILFGVTVATFIAGSVTLNVRLARGSLGKGVTFAQHLNEFVAKYWWRLRLVGRSRVPRTGPVIIAANHTCSVDPLLLCAVTPFRTIAFLVAAEFSELPVARYFLRLVDCIPVRRGETDPSAVKAALRHLQRGGALGIFIEGRIVPPGESAEPKDGAASLALRSGAMVLPAFIRGTQYTDNILRGLLSRYRAEVRFGKPVDLSDLAGNRRDRNIVKEATARIYAAIRALEDADVPGRSRPGDPSAA